MDTPRYICVLLSNLYFIMSNVSPTHGSEMGTLVGDRLVEPINRSQLSTSVFVYTVLKWFLTVYLTSVYMMAYTQEHVSMSMYEYFIFGLCTCGFLIRMWAYYKLGRLFTFFVGIRENHVLITDGPYRWVLHPSYLGQLIVLICYLLFFEVRTYIVILVSGFLLWQLGNRMDREEAVLRGHFDDTFDDYKKSRYRLVPFVY